MSPIRSDPRMLTVKSLGHISRAQVLAGLEFQFILFMFSRGPFEVRMLFGMGFGLIGKGKGLG